MARRQLSTTTWVILGLLFCAAALGLATYLTARNLMAPRSQKITFKNHSSDIGVLNIEGVIFDPKDIYESLDEIEHESSIKALLLRINSPGGAVAPTQEIHRRLIKIREKMPVACSLGDIAASGGYYIASACNVIFTNPGTLTGSIGVIMQFMNLGDLYQWAKMKPLTIKAGKMKDVGSPFRDMTQTEKDYLQSLVDSIHVQFKNDISKNRKVPANSMLNYTDGRIFSGEQAVQYGFADKLGGKEDAVAYLAEKAKISGTPNLIEWPEEKKGFSTFFESKAQNLFKRIPLLGVITKPQLQSGVPYLLPAFWMENLQ